MAQLRQKKDEFEAAGAMSVSVLPMDGLRTATFKRTRSGPILTVSDAAGRASALYGVAKQLIVHNEWVNSPSTFVIDTGGIITYAHVGDYWGDRPSADDVLNEVRKAK